VDIHNSHNRFNSIILDSSNCKCNKVNKGNKGNKGSKGSKGSNKEVVLIFINNKCLLSNKNEQVYYFVDKKIKLFNIFYYSYLYLIFI